MEDRSNNPDEAAPECRALASPDFSSENDEHCAEEAANLI
jgi:hypothetical protein